MIKYIITGSLFVNPHIFALVSAILGFGIALSLLSEYQYFPIFLECLTDQEAYNATVREAAVYEWKLKVIQSLNPVEFPNERLQLEQYARELIIDKIKARLGILRASEAKLEGSKLIRHFYNTLPLQ